jgi:hypothetical protein
VRVRIVEKVLASSGAACLECAAFESEANDSAPASNRDGKRGPVFRIGSNLLSTRRFELVENRLAWRD